MKKPKDVNEYIASYPAEVQSFLQEVRETIRKAAPDATEVISYGMPAFKWNGMLVWYGAHTKHIGFYPKGAAIEAFKKEISQYKSAKGSVQFPYDQPMPLKLISKMVKFGLEENRKNKE
jgi:uncharacterized protein YdhG (YjbR/CyaY superfamily)